MAGRSWESLEVLGLTHAYLEEQDVLIVQREVTLVVGLAHLGHLNAVRVGCRVVLER